MIKVAIVDDHPMLRTGLAQTINREPDIKVVAECESGEQLLSLLSENDFNIIILDIDLPGRNGIEILKDVKKQSPNTAVVILSAYDEQRYGVRAIQAGANSYLSKGTDKKIILEALRRINGNKKYITPELAEVLAEGIDSTSDKLPHEKLSDRELEIMRHIALGKSVSEIAELLSLSVNTVNTYRARVMEKMCMKSNTQLALYALENKLIDKF
jgi:two-component system, NarL family, invasion response regulator UvrY